MVSVIGRPQHGAEAPAGAGMNRAEELLFGTRALRPVLLNADPPSVGKDEGGNVDCAGRAMS